MTVCEESACVCVLYIHSVIFDQTNPNVSSILGITPSSTLSAFIQTRRVNKALKVCFLASVPLVRRTSRLTKETPFSPFGLPGWDNTATIDHVLRVFQEFSPAMRTLLGLADPASIKLWRLYDRRALGTWVRGSAALLGDAAHPFLPHQGQGGAQAIEDGAALGALLPLGTHRDEVPQRLQLYMRARYDRATMVQNFSRQMAFQTSEEDTVGGFSMDPLEFSAKNFNHDAFAHAQRLLEVQ